MTTSEESREIRSHVMSVFRRWGGQWNVTVGPAPEGGSWRLVVHSRRVVSGELSERGGDSLLKGEGETAGSWAAELRPLFQAAVEASREE
ncbi:MAG: hypothetical protein HY702_01485 [Gemmatimonadetes bacterium]|nr:hypothetical protein [Gemmatimonadota bacterium]